jgi:hypothetical protein
MAVPVGRGRKTRLIERHLPYLRVVHLFRLRPHVPEHFVQVALEHAQQQLRRDRASHHHQGVDGKIGIRLIRGDSIALEEATHLEPFVFRLVPDAAQAFGRRAIVRQLKYPVQQDRYILEFGPSALFDFRNDQVAQVRVGTA